MNSKKSKTIAWIPAIKQSRKYFTKNTDIVAKFGLFWLILSFYKMIAIHCTRSALRCKTCVWYDTC